MKSHTHPFYGFKVLRIAIFLSILSIPLLAGLFGYTHQSTSENRRLAEKPHLSRNTLTTYASAYQQYYSDTFPFRAPLITAQNYLTVGLLKSSPRADVIIGKQGWLFYDTEGPLQQEKSFTQPEVESIRSRVSRVHDEFERQGIKFYLFITPNAQTIYPEHLPDYLRPHAPSRFDQMTADFEQHGLSPILIDPREAIRTGKKEHQAYRKYDTHWDDYGAFIAYHQLMTRIAYDFPLVRPLSLNDFTITAKKIPNTDLLNMLAMTGFQTEYAPSLTPNTPRAAHESILSCRFSPNCETIETTVEDPRLPRLLMYRDSFSNHLIPFVGEHFRNARYRWTHTISQRDVQTQKPDIVIYQIVERNLPALRDLRIEN